MPAKRLRLSELGILPPHPVISVTNIYIDGKRYEVGDDGDTLIPWPPELRSSQSVK